MVYKKGDKVVSSILQMWGTVLKYDKETGIYKLRLQRFNKGEIEWAIMKVTEPFFNKAFKEIK